MSLKRYGVFVVCSLLLHGLLAQAMERNPMEIALAPAENPGPISVKMMPTVTRPAPPEPAPPKPEPKPEPKPKPEPAKPKPKPKPEPKPEPKPKPKPVPKPEPAPRPAPKPAPAPEPVKQAPREQPQQTKNSAPKRIEKPSFKTRPSPIAYPVQARRRGLEGTVVVEVWLDEQGKQTKRVLARSSGVNVLDKAAIKAIAKWQFSAYIENGQALAHRVQIPIRFKLD
ncbi:energy transducer TonB [Oceanimonas smirnovii]|uniref:energy transducer TonB n=1 Tax=Oceanimonas smirnovii TaxID=264574 RepID=UPI0004777F3D|nr:energy transducer TonB [Oceanimonas smirnovii]